MPGRASARRENRAPGGVDRDGAKEELGAHAACSREPPRSSTGEHSGSSRCHAVGSGLYTVPVPANEQPHDSRDTRIGRPHLQHVRGAHGVTSELESATQPPEPAVAWAVPPWRVTRTRTPLRRQRPHRLQVVPDHLGAGVHGSPSTGPTHMRPSSVNNASRQRIASWASERTSPSEPSAMPSIKVRARL